MSEVFVYRSDGGDWGAPGLWRVADWETGQWHTLTNLRAADRAPGAGDDVLFANTPGDPSWPDGWLGGGGSARDVYVAPDWTPVVLTGDPDPAPEIFRFRSLHVDDRAVVLRDAVLLVTDTASLDMTSSLNVSQADVWMDTVGRPYSASFGGLVLEERPEPARYGDVVAGGTLHLGNHSVIAGEFVNGNDWAGPRGGITGIGEVFGPTAPHQPPPAMPEWVSADQAASIEHWLGFAAGVCASMAASGSWEGIA